jgi:hypothetical protein
MSHRLRQPEAKKVKTGLLVDEDELNIEKLWGVKISGPHWHNRIRNISTGDPMSDLHQCSDCGESAHVLELYAT